MAGPDDGACAGTSAGTQSSAPERVLYPVFESRDDTVLHVAAGIAQSSDAEMCVGHVGTDSFWHASPVDRDLTRTVDQGETDPGVHAERQSLAGALDAVVSGAGTSSVEAVVLGDDAPERQVAKLAGEFDCDVVVVNDGSRPEAIASVLVPVAGGPHSGAAVETAAAVAEASDAWIELIHVVDTNASDAERTDATELLERCQSRATAAPDVDTRVVEGERVSDAIIEESGYHDLTVIGAPQSGRLRRLIFGSTTADVRERAHGTVVMVRHRSSGESNFFSNL